MSYRIHSLSAFLHRRVHVLKLVCCYTERTKDRPIARGDITRTQAFGFLGLQLAGGLAVLMQFNWYTYDNMSEFYSLQEKPDEFS